MEKNHTSQNETLESTENDRFLLHISTEVCHKHSMLGS